MLSDTLRDYLQIADMAVRDLVDHTLGDELGLDWHEKVGTDKQRVHWGVQHKRRRSWARARGASLDFIRPIDSIPFAGVVALIRTHVELFTFWDPDEREKVLLVLAKGEPQGVARMDELLPLFADLRLLALNKLGTRDANGRLYPRIDLIRDNFENYVWSRLSFGHTLKTGTMLRSNGEVRFTCYGTVDLGLDLQWTFLALTNQNQELTSSVRRGNAVEFVWQPRVDELGINTRILLFVEPTRRFKQASTGGLDGRDHVRERSWLGFGYTVLPSPA